MSSIKEVKDLLRKDRKDEANALLKQIIREDPSNERAWILFTKTLSDDEERVKILNQGRKINPNSQRIQQELERLTGLKSEKDLSEKSIVNKPDTKISVPLAAFSATLITVGRLFIVGVSHRSPFSREYTYLASIAEYLFFGYGTLEVDIAIHTLLASIIIWLSVFTLLWLVFSIISRAIESRTR